MPERGFALAALAAGLLVLSAPAEAHKLKVFATTTGAAIDGYAYFVPGGRAQDMTVTVAGPDGAVLMAGKTDSEGAFHYEATRRIDTTITVDGGDGHVARATVAASDLPDSLPGGAGAVAGPSAPQASSAPPEARPSDAALRAVVEDSVARAIRPLREEIDAAQEKIWMHDVLGGVGIIFGVGGLAFGASEYWKRSGGRAGAAARTIRAEGRS